MPKSDTCLATTQAQVPRQQAQPTLTMTKMLAAALTWSVVSHRMHLQQTSCAMYLRFFTLFAIESSKLMVLVDGSGRPVKLPSRCSLVPYKFGASI